MHWSRSRSRSRRLVRSSCPNPKRIVRRSIRDRVPPVRFFSLPERPPGRRWHSPALWCSRTSFHLRRSEIVAFGATHRCRRRLLRRRGSRCCAHPSGPSPHAAGAPHAAWASAWNGHASRCGHRRDRRAGRDGRCRHGCHGSLTSRCWLCGRRTRSRLNATSGTARSRRWTSRSPSCTTRGRSRRSGSDGESGAGDSGSRSRTHRLGADDHGIAAAGDHTTPGDRNPTVDAGVRAALPGGRSGRPRPELRASIWRSPPSAASCCWATGHSRRACCKCPSGSSRHCRRVSYPTMARLRAIGDDTRQVVERLARMTALAAGAILAPLAASAHSLVPGLFGGACGACSRSDGLGKRRADGVRADLGGDSRVPLL